MFMEGNWGAGGGGTTLSWATGVGLGGPLPPAQGHPLSPAPCSCDSSSPIRKEKKKKTGKKHRRDR